MSEKLPITLKIKDRPYKLTVARSEEEKFRDATKRINNLIETFKGRFIGNDDQDLLAMVSLQLAHRLIEFESAQKNTTTNDTLEKICEELDEFIKINQ